MSAPALLQTHIPTQLRSHSEFFTWVLAIHLALSSRPSPHWVSHASTAKVRGRVVRPTAEMEKLMAVSRPSGKAEMEKLMAVARPSGYGHPPSQPGVRDRPRPELPVGRGTWVATRKHWQPQEPSLCQGGLGHGAPGPTENRALDGRGTQVPGALGVLLWWLRLHSGLGSSLAVEALSLSCPLCTGLVPCGGPMGVAGTQAGLLQV